MQVQFESKHHLNLGTKQFESNIDYFEYLTKNGYFKTEEKMNCHPIWVHHTGQQSCYQID